MAGNQVDIIIRAVDKGVKSAFSSLKADLKTSRLAMDAFKASVKKTNQVTSRLGGELKAAFAGVGFGVVTKQLWDAGTETQRLNLAFEAIAGSSKGAGEELSFVRDEVDRLGLVFNTTAQSYKQIFAAGTAGNVELETTRKIFSGFAESFTALGLSGEQSTSALRAIGQMMGKNKVQAEELRQQLGEHLPVAIQYFADAAGVSVSELEEMMERGEVGIDVLARTADLLSKDFGPKAEEAAKKATGAINSWKNAWWDLKVTLSEAGFLDKATGYLNSMTTALKDPGVQKAIRVWAERFFDMADAIIKTAWNHKELLVGLLATGAAVKIITSLASAVTGVAAAYKVLLGLNLVSWLTSVRVAALAAASAWQWLGAAMVAVWSGKQVGEAAKQAWEMKEGYEHLRQTEEALIKTEEEHARKLELISAATGYTVKSWEEVIRLKQQGLIHFDKEAQAWKRGAKVMTDVSKDVAEGAKESFDEQKEVSEETLKEMTKQYKKYVDEVLGYQKEIASRQRDLNATLRDIARSAMDDVSAWKDQKKEAQEYYSAAEKAYAAGEKALAAGDKEAAAKYFEEAVGNADDASRAYEELNHEVEKNGKVLISQKKAAAEAGAGVKAAGELAIQVLKAQEQAAIKAAQALDMEAGGKLSDQIPGIGKALDAVEEKTNHYATMVVPQIGKAFTVGWKEAEDSGKAALNQIDLATREITETEHKIPLTASFDDGSLDEAEQKTESYANVVVPRIGKAFTTVWSDSEKKGKAMIKEVSFDVDKFVNKKRVMEIDVKVNYPSGYDSSAPTIDMSAMRLGGLVGAQMLAAGGAVRNALSGFFFPGYGGGDQPKNLVMAENGEVMIRKEMVRAAGLKAALAWNAGDFKTVLAELLKRFSPGAIIKKQLGGLIGGVQMPAISPMNLGGAVAAAGVGGRNFTFQQTFNGAVDTPSRRNARRQAVMLMEEIERIDVRGS